MKIFKASQDHLQLLREIHVFTYKQTYEPFEEVPESYLVDYTEGKYSLANLTVEMADPNIQFYLAEVEEEVVGYLKVELIEDEKDFGFGRSLKVDRLYVKNTFAGRKIGLQFMQKAEALGRELKVSNLWLAAFHKNKRAIDFYKKYGFENRGTIDWIFNEHIFKDVTYVFKKELL